MIYLALIFIPPVYFISRKKWGGFCLNAILYGIACLCVISIVGIVAAPFFWLLAVGHASFTFKREQLDRHADRVATKLAEKINQTK